MTLKEAGELKRTLDGHLGRRLDLRYSETGVLFFFHVRSLSGPDIRMIYLVAEAHGLSALVKVYDGTDVAGENIKEILPGPEVGVWLTAD